MSSMVSSRVKLEVAVSNRQSLLQIDESRMRQLVHLVLPPEGYSSAEISLAIVDNASIHQLNRDFLQHDYPTDVLSFVFERQADYLDGEVIVSAQMALSQARSRQWPVEHELLLYVLHGILHLVGYDDQSDSSRREMVAREHYYLTELGIDPQHAQRDGDCPTHLDIAKPAGRGVDQS